MARSSVSASSVPLRTTSYSRSPSWSTASPVSPLLQSTNRRDTKVGNPDSCGPPSAVEADGARRRTRTRRRNRRRGLGSGKCAPHPVVAHAVVELDPDAHESLVRRAARTWCAPRPAPDARRCGASTMRRRRPRARASCTRASTRRRDRTGPGLQRAHPHELGRVDDEVLGGRRVVVGVATVARLDEPVGVADRDAVGGGERDRAVGRCRPRRGGGRWP